MIFSKPRIVLSALATLLLALASCDTLVDDRIPAMPVNINLGGHGMWNTYGVSGYGQYNRFILYSNTRLPSGFPYTETSRTGFGGVLLISCVDPFSGDMGPMAYDLACPVERKQTVRVEVDPENYEAFCPECGSRYNITERGGSPISGPALTSKYQLKRYNCIPAGDGMGGYIITNR